MSPCSSRSGLFSLLLFVLALIISPLSAFAAKEPFNVSVSDQSPTISYGPSRTGPSDSTWNVTYTDSSWSTYVNQTIGQGISSHYTTSVGANATLGWWGTAVYVWAEAADQDIQVIVDGQVNAKKVDGGWMATGLSEGWHRVRVKVVGGGGVRLYGITFTTGVGESGANPVNSTIQTIFGPNSINGLFGSSTGQWETGTEVGGVPGQSAQPYNRLDTYTAGSQLIFQPPSNTSFILLHGSVNFDHGAFSVSLSTSNLPGVQVSGDSEDNGDGSSSTTTTVTTIGGTPANQTLRGRSPWVSIDQVIYYASLDPSAQYVVTVENQAQGRQYWDVAKVVFVQAQGGSSGGDSSSNAAAIAGGVAGGVAALGIAGILIWFFVVRKRRQNRQKQEPSNFTQYEDKPFEVDPYRYDDGEDAQAAYANAAAGTHTPMEMEGGAPSPSGHGRPDSTLAPLLGHPNSPHSPGRRDSRNSRLSYASASAQSTNPHRLSLPTSDGMGGYYNPYFTPSSSRHASLQATPENGNGNSVGLGINGTCAGAGAAGMVVHNPDSLPHLEADEDHQSRHSVSPYLQGSPAANNGSLSDTTKSRAAGNGTGQIRNRDQRRSEIIQERDAGAVPLPPMTQEHQEPVVVPPRYDPSWGKGWD
ncbi:hypothetical protein IAT40_003417 [Kwoniella sp. CBS 6097]